MSNAAAIAVHWTDKNEINIPTSDSH